MARLVIDNPGKRQWQFCWCLDQLVRARADIAVGATKPPIRLVRRQAIGARPRLKSLARMRWTSIPALLPGSPHERLQLSSRGWATPVPYASATRPIHGALWSLTSCSMPTTARERTRRLCCWRLAGRGKLAANCVSGTTLNAIQSSLRI